MATSKMARIKELVKLSRRLMKWDLEERLMAEIANEYLTNK
jgi:hypothetical protein